MNIEQEIIKLLSKQLLLPADKINLNAELEHDLGADSLDIVEISMEIEDLFNISMEIDSFEDLLKIKTVAELIAYIKSRLTAKAPINQDEDNKSKKEDKKSTPKNNAEGNGETEQLSLFDL